MQWTSLMNSHWVCWQLTILTKYFNLRKWHISELYSNYTAIDYTVLLLNQCILGSGPLSLLFGIISWRCKEITVRNTKMPSSAHYIKLVSDFIHHCLKLVSTAQLWWRNLQQLFYLEWQSRYCLPTRRHFIMHLLFNAVTFIITH